MKEGEQYPSVINDTSVIGEEVNISYTVTPPQYVIQYMSVQLHARYRTFDIPDVAQYGMWTNVCLATCPLSHAVSLPLFSLQIEKVGDMVTPPLELKVTYPHLSPRNNHLLYLINVTASPQVGTQT